MHIVGEDDHGGACRGHLIRVDSMCTRRSATKVLNLTEHAECTIEALKFWWTTSIFVPSIVSLKEILIGYSTPLAITSTILLMYLKEQVGVIGQLA